MTYADFFYEVKGKFMGADVSDIQEHLAYQFNIEDEEAGGAFYVEVKDGVLFVEPYEYYDRDAMFISTPEVFRKIADGEMDPVWAFTTQKLRVEGNIDKALKLNDIIQRKKKEAKKAKKEAKKEAKEASWKRTENRSGTLRIGYAGRIVRQAKRADLLVGLLDLLEKNRLKYVLQIAGEGECLELIAQYIVKNKLQDRVLTLGRLPKSRMDSFWKNQDVFVNVSEYEGTSLSMLEAMGYGCVPVVTDVSGAREFIGDKKNGYICDVGDIKGIADCITELAKNRELLKTYGDRCRRIVQERCNPVKYIKYWIEEVLGDWL